MEQEINKLKLLIDSSKRVLITSHISPDPDALTSVLLLGTTLKKNYPNKVISMALEEKPEGLDFLTGYQDIHFGQLFEVLARHNPDLFIMLDAVNYERCSRRDGEAVRQYIEKHDVITVVIDHHQLTDKSGADIYINQGSIATVQDVYEVCFKQLKFDKPKGYGEATMLGIYSDSGGFTYADPRHRETFKIISDLIDSGVSVESIKNRLNQYTKDQLKALSEFINNTSHNNKYSHSYLEDEFVTDWQKSGKSLVSLNTAAAIFVDQFIRNIEDVKWGFVAYLNPLAGENIYSVSFRAQSDVKDVSKIAGKLGGGGHKPAAGARIQARNINDAINKVRAAINDS